MAELAATEYGAGGDGAAGAGRPIVVILHGLFGSGRNWAGIAGRLAETCHVIALDLRNHGASFWAESMSYAEMAADVLAFLDARGLARVALLGHSMGGKVAMCAALRRPERVARLIVADIAPVAYPPGHLAYVEALHRLDLDGLKGRAEAERRLAPAVPDRDTRLFLLQNLVREDGRFRWRINLTAIARDLAGLAGFAPPPRARYEGPALFVTGARSGYVRPEHREAIRHLFPHAHLVTLREAGHWLHAEQPEAFLRTVQPFLTVSTARMSSR